MLLHLATVGLCHSGHVYPFWLIYWVNSSNDQEVVQSKLTFFLQNQNGDTKDTGREYTVVINSFSLEGT